MAKDDYEVIVYKILTYLYGCMKRVTAFDIRVFDKVIRQKVTSEGYFTDILRMMQGEGLITGAVFQKAWGREYLLLSDMEELEITAEGIRYLKDNSRTERAKAAIKETSDIITGLVDILRL